MTFFRDLPGHLFVPHREPLPGIRFRAARDSDRHSLREACYPDRPIAQFLDGFRRSLSAQASGNRVHIIAEVQAKLIGSAQLVGYTHKAEIADLAVASAYRNYGVGTAIIAILTQIGQFAGFRKIEIGVMAGNTQALELYKRLGFEPMHEILLPGDTRAIILQKILRT